MNSRSIFVFFFFFSLFGIVFGQVDGCETGNEVYNKYGLDRTLLEWDLNRISVNMCEEPLIEGESGYFCDATQFSIMLFKKYEKYKDEINRIVENLSEEERQALSSVRSLSDLNKIVDYNFGFKALLIKDNYSKQFKEDFNSIYGSTFFQGIKIVISDWVFENSPEQTGFYDINLEAPVSFDGEQFEFSQVLSIKFELIDSLESLDEKLSTGFFRTEFSKNSLLRIPFDAKIGNGERDYGSRVGGPGIWLSDIDYFTGSGSISSLKTEKGETYADTAQGIVFALGLIDENKQEYYSKFNESIPAVILVHLTKDLNRDLKIYYTIGDIDGGAMPLAFYGARDSLLEWKSLLKTVRDEFPVLRPDIICRGWVDEIPSAFLEIGPGSSGDSSYHSIGFFPEDTTFSVQCISDKNVEISMSSYDGKALSYPQSISPRANDFLGGVLKPKDWDGIFSLKDAIEEVKSGRMCVIAKEQSFVLAWNPNTFLREAGLIGEAVYEKEAIDDLCRIYPGDVREITKVDGIPGHEEEQMKLFWCREQNDCGFEGGYRSYSKPYDRCKRMDRFCCYKPMSEDESQCLNEPMYVFLEYESPDVEFIEKIIEDFPEEVSPALEDKSLAESFIRYSMDGWHHEHGDGTTFGKNVRFDPLIPLAFFAYESTMGTHPDFNPERKSIGNIKKALNAAQIIKQPTLCTNPSPEFGEFCGYNEWWESVRHWNWLIEENYVSEGKETVRDILYKYAPPEDNNTEEYIDFVKKRVCHWRELWREYLKRKEEELFVSAVYSVGSSTPILKSVYFQPPSPTVQDELICIAEASDTDNDPLTYTFIWKRNSMQIMKATLKPPAGTNKMKTIQIIKKAGDVYECSVIVSDGKTESGPLTAKVTIAEEHPEGPGGSEEKDSDEDGVPDASDKCPFEAGLLVNSGCPVGQPPEGPEGPLVPEENQVLFIFMPIDWQGTQESFEREMEAQLAFLREKSGIADVPECSNLEFVERALPKSLASECGISVSPYIDDPTLLLNITNCMKRRVGVSLNHRKIIFAGLTDIEPGKSLGKWGFVDKRTGESNFIGFHIYPNPPVPGYPYYQKQKEAFEAYKNSQITIAMASFVGSPKTSFQVLSHEIGHCLGFCEQYSLASRVEQDSMYASLGFSGCTNKYPGAYQVNWNKATPLLGEAYEKCPEESFDTACPEIVTIQDIDAESLGITEKIKTNYIGHVVVRSAELAQAPQIQITDLPNVDCFGRRFMEKGKATRDMMGPGSATLSWISEAFPSAGYSPNPERSFDCFEKEQFISQWCSS